MGVCIIHSSCPSANSIVHACITTKYNFQKVNAIDGEALARKSGGNVRLNHVHTHTHILGYIIIIIIIENL